ncbi:MAG: hypothetical protein L0H36_02955 [bacterium]|nr:hypothetical protein [bacterium]MDN5835569.1 hypothetical protein [bacterium]
MIFFSIRYSRLWRKLNHAKAMMSLSSGSAEKYAKIGVYLSDIGRAYIHLQEMKGVKPQTVDGKEVVLLRPETVNDLQRIKAEHPVVDSSIGLLDFTNSMRPRSFVDRRQQLAIAIDLSLKDISTRIDMESSQSLRPFYQNRYYKKLYETAS